MAMLNSVGFLTKVRSMAKYSAEDSVLQVVYTAIHISLRVQNSEPSVIALEKLSLYLCFSLFPAFFHF